MVIDPVRIGIIGETGRGGFGHQIDRGFQASSAVDIVAFSDPVVASWDAESRVLPNATPYEDFREMIDRSDVEAVVVATRNVTAHLEHIAAALGAGKHVYAEKPLTRDLSDADALIRTAEARGLVFANALPGGSEPRFLDLQRRLDEGFVGRIWGARGLCKWDSRGGGEDALVLGLHLADMACRLFGPVRRVYARVSLDGVPITVDDAYEGGEGVGPVAGDSYFSVLEHQSGVNTTIESYRAGETDRSRHPYRLDVFGSEGTVSHRAPYADGLTALTRSLGSFDPASPHEVWSNERVTYESHHERSANAFACAVRGRGEPLCTARDGRRALEIVHAGYESALKGMPADLPLVSRDHPLRSANR